MKGEAIADEALLSRITEDLELELGDLNAPVERTIATARRRVRQRRIAWTGASLAAVAVAGVAAVTSSAGTGRSRSSGVTAVSPASSPNAALPSLPPDKQQLLDSELAEKSAAAREDPVAPTVTESYQPIPDYGPNGTIDNDPYQQGPFSEANLGIRNSWSRNVSDGGVLEVWAGSAMDDPAPGVGGVLVLHYFPNEPGTSATLTGPYELPSSTSLSITSAASGILTLTTNSGRKVHFDTRTDAFS